MNIKEYLKNSQPIVYQILKNSFTEKKTSHAYIINGNKGTPLTEIAILMAQSLVCQNKDEDNLACENCLICKKIQNQTYADFKMLNGEDLKTDAILSLQEDFNKSAMENENVQIYIINLIEKATIPSLNKLLKFIEEPTSNIVAIFTSNSVDSILPTIVSRCQVISLKQFMINDLVNALKDNNIPLEDAYLISKISNNIENNLQLAQSDNYQLVKNVLIESLNYLEVKDNYFIVYMQTKGLNSLNNNNLLDLYLDMLESCILEAIIAKEDNDYQPKFLKEHILEIKENYKHLEKMITDITNAKVALLSNANKNLVFDKLLINLIDR